MLQKFNEKMIAIITAIMLVCVAFGIMGVLIAILIAFIRDYPWGLF